MNERELNKFMTFRKNGIPNAPLTVFSVNGKYLLGVYRGSLSKFDILIKYRQKQSRSWSRIRTPKHIHWAADMLIKLHENPSLTQEFLDFLLEAWNRTHPVKNKAQQKKNLELKSLLKNNKRMIRKYDALGMRGEYSIKFLILLAKLLMFQEKTNMENAYMFKKLLVALRRRDDIFSIVSIASHTGRK